MNDESETGAANGEPDRWTLIRDVAVLQLKLLVDGLRDLVLVPVSLIAGAIGLLKGGDRPGSEFYDLLKFGRRSERWINLFGAADRVHGSDAADDELAVEDIDEMMTRVESFLVEEYKRGGVTAQAKDRLDQGLNSLQRLARKRRSSGS